MVLFATNLWCDWPQVSFSELGVDLGVDPEVVVDFFTIIISIGRQLRKNNANDLGCSSPSGGGWLLLQLLLGAKQTKPKQTTICKHREQGAEPTNSRDSWRRKQYLRQP